MWVYIGVENGKVRKDLVPDKWKHLIDPLEQWIEDITPHERGAMHQIWGCLACRQLGGLLYVKFMREFNSTEILIATSDQQ